MDGQSNCRICLMETDKAMRVQLKCSHIFCIECIRKYIQVLRMYNLLTPQKLSCFESGCKQQISDEAIKKIYPGQLGFVLCVVRKRYKESKDPNIMIFVCKGYVTQTNKHLVIKNTEISKQQHEKQITKLCMDINKGERQMIEIKNCKNIISFNKKIPRKQKYIRCNVCCCLYCICCLQLLHDGNCRFVKQEDFEVIGNCKGNESYSGNDENGIENYLERNGLIRCLNLKCRAGIEKVEGCFWVKCRCTWEMCYPCQKLWGDCQHFKYYPYQKFIPPSQWIVKAFNLY